MTKKKIKNHAHYQYPTFTSWCYPFQTFLDPYLFSHWSPDQCHNIFLIFFHFTSIALSQAHLKNIVFNGCTIPIKWLYFNLSNPHVLTSKLFQIFHFYRNRTEKNIPMNKIFVHISDNVLKIKSPVQILFRSSPFTPVVYRTTMLFTPPLALEELLAIFKKPVLPHRQK